MRVESRGAIRADDLQVLEPVVRRDAVDVVEDQRHAAAPPVLALAAQLATPLLQAGVVEPLLQLPAAVAGVLDEHLLEWDRAEPPTRAHMYRRHVEVVR